MKKRICLILYLVNLFESIWFLAQEIELIVAHQKDCYKLRPKNLQQSMRKIVALIKCIIKTNKQCFPISVVSGKEQMNSNTT